MNCLNQTQTTIFSFRKTSGFTLVETLTALGVLGLFLGAIALILQQILSQVGESRVRATALALAQERMELVRNLPYADVGVSGGIPQGPIAQTETVTINKQDFHINTSIIYIDDPFDGTTPTDLINTDYKRVRIEVTWEGLFPSRYPVVLVTNIVPKGVETIVGGGTLLLQVFNALGEPVPAATVTIDNTDVVPEIHMQTLTDNQGWVVIPGAPACVTCYKITVTKNGFSTDKTYGSEEVANPLLPHATILEGETTQLSFAIDRVGTVTIRSYGPAPNYAPVANVQFTLQGSKIIGYDTLDEPVYKYSYSTNTGGGIVTIPNLEWDTYTLLFTNSQHNLAGSIPLNPFQISPGDNISLNMVNVPKTNHSLLIAIKNAAEELQASASTRLVNTSLGYDVTKSTAATGSADYGQVFFGGLNQTVYDLTISLSGYQEATASIEVNGITSQMYILNLAE